MSCKTENSPLLSVVIATRNRIPYAISAIQSILEIRDSRLEVVVQDNSDSRDLESHLRDNILDSRLRYQYTPPPLSMIDNFNAAVGLAKGEYVCLIGDDDGVNPEIMEAASWAEDNDVDALAVKLRATYFWHGTGVRSTLFTKVLGGALSVSGFRGSISNADLEKELRRLMRDGGAYYLRFALPKLYHGLVRRRCLEAVYQKTRSHFGGLSPDIFAALTIACVATRVVVTDYPLTISGVCPGSGSTYGRTSGSTNRLEDTFLWRGRREYHWCEFVPRLFTPETVWADSGVAALRAMGRHDLIRQLDVSKLAAYCVCANRGVTRPVLRALFDGIHLTHKSPVIGSIHFAASLLTGPGGKFVRRVWNRLLMILAVRTVDRVDGLADMVEASHGLTRYLRENRRSFADCTRRWT